MSRRTRVLATLAGVCALPASASAYVTETSHWNPASLPIVYHVNTGSIPASLGSATGVAAVEGGFATWAGPACTTGRATDAGSTTGVANSSDRTNNILWVSGSWPAELGSVSSVIGITIPVWTVGGYFIDADIQFNNVGFTWSTTGARGTVDAQSIATHEEGHFLGLDHTTVPGAIMLASYSGGLVRNLSSDDQNGVCALYPSGRPAGDAGTTPVDAGTTTGGDMCSRYTTCAGCTPVNGCGWCGATNQCVSSTQTGPVAGSCGSGFAWLPNECTATPPPTDSGTTSSDPCSTNTACGTCTPVNNCGWCNATARCVTSNGAGTGPQTGTCASGWAYQPADCASLPAADGGTMTPTGGANFGEPCRSPTDCASGGLCVGSTTIAAFCTHACTDDCTCERGYACRGMLTTGQRICIPGTNTCASTDAGTVTPTDTGSTTPTDTGSTTNPGTDAGTVTPGTDAGTVAPGTDAGDGALWMPAQPGGCGCHVPARGGSSSGALALTALAGLAAALRRRRR